MRLARPNIVVLDEEKWGGECDDFMNVSVYRSFP